MTKRSRSRSQSKASEDSDSLVGNEDSHQSSSAIMLTRKRRRKTGVQTVGEICQEILDKLKAVKSEEGILSDLLWKVPLKRIVPEYHETVKQPIDLATIQSKVRDDQYEQVDQMQADLLLMVTNTKLFYGSDCEETSAAEQLMKHFESERERIQNAPPSAADSASVASSSSRMRHSLRRDIEESESDDFSESRSESSRNMSESNASNTSGRKKPGNMFQNYFAFIAKHITEDGRALADTFSHLPSKKIYPQYYEVIKEPIDLRMVAGKVQSSAYANLEEMYRDFQLMAKNAKTFNEPRSVIYQDGVTLSKISKKRFHEFEQKTKTGRRNRLNVPGAADVAESFTTSKPPTDALSDSDLDVTQPDEEQDFERGEEIRFPVADPRYPYRRLYDIVSSQPIIDPFMRLPSASLYPDYYEEIKAPISMLMIRNKINANSYRCLDELVKDFDLMFDNAKLYNVEDSAIFKNASRLQRMVHDVLEEMIRFMSDGNRDLSGFYSALSCETTDGSHLSDTLASVLGSHDSYALSIDSRNVFRMGKKSPLSNSSGTKMPDNRGRKPWSPGDFLKRRLLTIYKSIFNCKNGDRLVRDIFMTLPSKEEYPDYYEVIPEPIDLTTIKQRIDANKYDNHQPLVDDLRLMLKNAKHYNEVNSQVYRDAVFLENTLKNRLRNLGSLGVKRDGSSGGSDGKGVGGFSRKNLPRVHPAAVRAQIEQRRMRELYLTVKEYRDRSGRMLSAPFMRLPTRLELPEYYEVIAKPVELLEVGDKLDAGAYKSVDDLMDDLITMFVNACCFNASTSVVYKDALTLHRVCLEKKAVLLAEEDILSAEGLGVAQMPQVFVFVRDILTRLFVRLHNYEDDEGRCLSDSFANVTGTVPAPSAATAAASCCSLDQVKRQLDAGCYRRLDRFQADIFHVLRFIRQVSPVSSRAFQDSATLQRVFIQLRNEITDNGRRLSSPALRYTEQDWEKEIQTSREANKLSEESDGGAAAAADTVEMDLFASPSAAGVADPPGSVHVNGSTVHLHDFVYLAPDKRIAYVAGISEQKDDATATTNATALSSLVHVHYLLRAGDNALVQQLGKKCHNNEVFLTESKELVPAERIMGRCVVLWIKDFVVKRPKGVEDADLYVCESYYLEKTQTIRKLTRWNFKVAADVELEDRPVPLMLMRNDTHVLPLSSPVANQGILDIVRENVISEEKSQLENIVNYDQVVCSNGFSVKLGDFVYLPATMAKDKHIVRIERLWHSTVQNLMYFSGPWLLRETDLDPTLSAIYERQLFLSASPTSTHTLGAVVGKCYVMTPHDFCVFRPTEYTEEDVYVCESMYHADETNIIALPTPFTTFKLASNTCEEEFYYFPKPIKLMKKTLAMSDPKLSMGTTSMSSMEQKPSSSTGSNNALNHKSIFKKGFRKPPTAYVLYAAEMRKRLQPHRPDAHFGDLSREVGLMWRSLPDDQKEIYERRAQEIRADMEEDEMKEKAARMTQQQQQQQQHHHQQQQQPHHHHQQHQLLPMKEDGDSNKLMPSNAPGGIVGGGHPHVMIMHANPGGGVGAMTSSYQPHPSYSYPPVSYQQQPHHPDLMMSPSGQPMMAGGGLTAQPTMMIHHPQYPQTMYQLPNGQQVLAPAGVNVHHHHQGVGGAGSPGHLMSVVMPRHMPPPASPSAAPMMATHVPHPAGGGGGGVDFSGIQNATVLHHSNNASPPFAPQMHHQLQQQGSQPLLPPQASMMGGGGPTAAVPCSSSASVPPPGMAFVRSPAPPMFVSVPPKPVKLMHSKVYSKYIETLRNNHEYLSDWPRQMGASRGRAGAAASQHSDHVASQFMLLDNSKHHSSSLDALWALRDFLLRDTCNIRNKILGYKDT